MTKSIETFRVHKCPDFLDRKCQFHKPTTCFYWHFENQRRRPVFIKENKDAGHFNYCADIYCTSYDENTGHCVYGDHCRFLHRNYGDSERLYHPRYLKTIICQHSIDQSGNCAVNGLWCPYAHSSAELRTPTFDLNHLRSDILSIWAQRNITYDIVQWNSHVAVLLYYKSEICPNVAKHCKNTQTCPFFHSERDFRRSWLNCQYSSSICPSAREDSSEPCVLGKTCNHCHTRAEQQFHPEVYKSSMCADLTTTGYCPRGVFCSFAHTEYEVNKDYGAILFSIQTSLPADLPSGPFPGISLYMQARTHSMMRSTAGVNTGSPLSYSFPLTDKRSSNEMTNLKRSPLMSTPILKRNASFSRTSLDNLLSRGNPDLPSSPRAQTELSQTGSAISGSVKSEQFEKLDVLKRLCFEKAKETWALQRIMMAAEDELYWLLADSEADHPRREADQFPQFELDLESGDMLYVDEVDPCDQISALKDAIDRVTREIEERVAART